jgi:hypothetical protein
VQAVVYEHLDVAKLFDQRRQALPARTFQIRPPIAACIGDRGTGLGMQAMIEGERQVNTPQVAAIVPLERLKDDPARHAVRDAGLDHDLGAGMDNGAPDSAAQRAVGVGIPAVSIVAAEAPPFRRQQGTDISHKLIEALRFWARPGSAKHAMQTLFPGLVRFGTTVSGSGVLPEFSGQRTAHAHRIDSESAQQSHHSLRASIFAPIHNSSVDDSINGL